jgi:hypothetical protein
MFDLPPNYLDNLLVKAREITDVERMQYEAVYDVIEKYIRDNNLVVNRDLHRDRVYTIYTPYSVRSAIGLANAIADVCKYTRMMTSIPHREFIISVDGRYMVRMYTLENYKGVSLAKLIQPVNVGGFRRIPPEIELIDYYHTLYSPDKVDEWEETKQLVEHITITSDRVKAGGKSGPPQYKDVLMQLFEMTTDCILVGEHAIEHPSSDGFSDSSAKIQCVSADIDKDKADYKQALDRQGAKLEFREQELKLPTDSRIRRVSGYARVFRNGRMAEYPVIDLFNCAEYELVPYTIVDGRMIGHQYVLLRFIYIDAWILKIVSALKIINAETASRLTNHMLQLADTLREEKDVPLPATFIGTWWDPIIANKKIARTSGFYPYDPYKYKESQGQYKNA